MALWQGRSKQKASGGKYWSGRMKKAREMGSNPINPKIDVKERKKAKLHERSYRKTTKKMVILSTNIANLNMGNGKFVKTKITSVVENPANRHFVRMNVLTMGAVVQTEDGLAKITSKPTQHGMVNAILIKK